MLRRQLRDSHFFQNCGRFQYNISWCYIDNDHNFERNEDLANVFLKWKDFILLFFQDTTNLFLFSRIRPMLPCQILGRVYALQVQYIYYDSKLMSKLLASLML